MIAPGIECSSKSGLNKYEKTQFFSCQDHRLYFIGIRSLIIQELAMIFTLHDGQEVDLQRVVDVSSIRDEGLDPTSISLSRIAFHIRVKSGGTIIVHKNYHFSDWAEAKKALEVERKTLIEKLSECSSKSVS